MESEIMTHKERAALALELKTPDYVPTFELEYQLAPDMCGEDFLWEGELNGKSQKEIDYMLEKNAELHIKIYSELGYSIIPLARLSNENTEKTARLIRKMTGDEYMITAHGDGTFAVPDGNDMYAFAYRIADDEEGLIQEARARADAAIERNKRYADAGIDSLILCDDYCYNSGPYLSPQMFAKYIAPYLADIISAARSCGQYTIKHTDGNIMPILDQLVACRPNAIHSLDPMAGVDIAEVKRLVGDKVCLCGNVNCATMQTGTDEEIIASAEYALKHGKPSGGYIYCTSNVPFKGISLEKYKLILDVWNKNKYY